MTGHDELLARADLDTYGRMELLRLKDELAAALRAALAAQPEPVFEGTAHAFRNQWSFGLKPMDHIVVYLAAAAGSATPGEET